MPHHPDKGRLLSNKAGLFSNKGGLFHNTGMLSTEKTSHRITKEEKSGKIVANQGIGKETAE